MKTLFVISALLAGGFSALTETSSVDPAQQQLGVLSDLGLPPINARWSARDGATGPTWTLNSGLEVSFHISTLDREIRIRTTNPATEKYKGQVIGRPYYPTAFIPWGGGGIYLMGGTTFRGATVVQKITFTEPTSIIDINTGNEVISNMSIGSVDVLYDDETPGRRHVAWISRFPTSLAPNAILLQFYNSRDVYLLDTDTTAYSLFASPDLPGSLLVPELGSNLFNRAWSRVHKDYGRVCVIRDGNPQSSQDLVILMDTDQDGDLDDYQSFHPAYWFSSEFFGPDQFTSP